MSPETDSESFGIATPKIPLVRDLSQLSLISVSDAAALNASSRKLFTYTSNQDAAAAFKTSHISIFEGGKSFFVFVLLCIQASG
jgi:hypothetical protein